MRQVLIGRWLLRNAPLRQAEKFQDNLVILSSGDILFASFYAFYKTVLIAEHPLNEPRFA